MIRKLSVQFGPVSNVLALLKKNQQVLKDTVEKLDNVVFEMSNMLENHATGPTFPDKFKEFSDAVDVIREFAEKGSSDLQEVIAGDEYWAAHPDGKDPEFD